MARSKAVERRWHRMPRFDRWAPLSGGSLHLARTPLTRQLLPGGRSARRSWARTSVRRASVRTWLSRCGRRAWPTRSELARVCLVIIQFFLSPGSHPCPLRSRKGGRGCPHTFVQLLPRPECRLSRRTPPRGGWGLLGDWGWGCGIEDAAFDAGFCDDS